MRPRRDQGDHDHQPVPHGRRGRDVPEVPQAATAITVTNFFPPPARTARSCKLSLCRPTSSSPATIRPTFARPGWDGAVRRDCGQPPTRCPSPCGKRWMLCLSSYGYFGRADDLPRPGAAGRRVRKRHADAPGDAVRRFEFRTSRAGRSSCSATTRTTATRAPRSSPAACPWWIRLQDSDPE